MAVEVDEVSGEAAGAASPRYLRRPRAAWVARLEDMSPRRFAVVSLVVFVTASLAIYWPQWPGSTHSIVGCPCGDIMQEVWFLKWTPWSILHGLNPLYTRWMDFPTGANLANNTAMPLLAIVLAPWTMLFGPVSSYNLLIWASFPVSAMSCWWVARRLGASNLGALAAGLVYGFSPFTLGQGYGHAFLTFVPLPPLIFYALFRLFVRQSGSARRWGLALGGLLLAQFFVSEEIAAVTAIVAVIGLAILALANRAALDEERLRYARRGAVVALAVMVVVGAYPVAFQLYGPEAIHGAVHGTVHSAFKLDLLSSLVPDRFQLVAPSFLAHLGNQFTGTDIVENGGYLGVGLVFALGLIVWRGRRERWVRFVAAMLLVSATLSMGRWLMVANHTIHVPMPWNLFAALPLVKAILASRFAIVTTFFVALLIAGGVTRWTTWATAPSRGRGDHRGRVNTSLALRALVSAVLYLPRVPLPTVPLPAVPSFFTSGEDRVIPEGSVVLPFPMSTAPNALSMYWQLRSDFRWRMIGGEAIIRTPRGHTTGRPAATRPTAVTQYLENLSGANTVRPVVNALLVTRMREFLFLNDVSSVVLDPEAPNAALASALFRDVMGPPTTVGGVELWLHAQTLARRFKSG